MSTSPHSETTDTSDLDNHFGIEQLEQELAAATLSIMTTEDVEDKNETRTNDQEEETFTLGGLSVTINPTQPKVNNLTTAGVTFKKEHRPEEGSKAEIELVRGITTNSYDKYKILNTSIKDPESLRTNFSLDSLLRATETLWKAYDMLDPCHILFPDPSRQNLVPKLDSSGKAKTMYLFKQHRHLTALEVAQSCEYYAKYITYPLPGGKSGTFGRELAWSYSHFRTHVEPSLYANVNKEFLRFKPEQQGGPLFLKLLLDKLVVNNDSNLEALITTTTTYNIKQMSKTEDISEVTALLESICDTIISLRNDEEFPLPEKFVQKMLKVFQTTSVEAFNADFKNLENQLSFNRRLKNSLNSPALLGIGQNLDIVTPMNKWVLNNSPDSLRVLWSYARSTYHELQVSGEWELAVRPPIERINTAGDTCTIADTPPTSGFSLKLKCWNCGGDHRVDECPEELNAERVETNKREFLRLRRKERRDKAKARKANGDTKPPHAWRPPEPDEGGKRIIYGRPYTWNPIRNGWDKDSTPDSGLSAHNVNSGPLPATTVSHTPQTAQGSQTSHRNPQDDDQTLTTQGTTQSVGTIPPEQLSQLQLDLANVAQALARFTH